LHADGLRPEEYLVVMKLSSLYHCHEDAPRSVMMLKRFTFTFHRCCSLRRDFPGVLPLLRAFIVLCIQVTSGYGVLIFFF
jgi:hypothetical protein